MRTFIVVVIVLLVLIIGGGLTATLIATNNSVLPVLTTTTVPDASPMVVVPWKAEQLFLLVGFLLFNLVGIAVTLAVIVWVFDRGLRNKGGSTTSAPATTGTAEE